jgi:hypothetical protein
MPTTPCCNVVLIEIANIINVDDIAQRMQEWPLVTSLAMQCVRCVVDVHAHHTMYAKIASIMHASTCMVARHLDEQTCKMQSGIGQASRQ